ncbi:hypothetical protein BDFB_011427 [Asbolus verrucosus]|uniref:Uncharacterized protein n=1 Tax=Asbolus verrucosus TaxID=1661398 RepID=A0A482VFE7_ASBVE|nr:hypothetical protein BDFB_011427 [Asbolus verrucosus]
MWRHFETIAIDLFGPLPEDEQGYKWIFIREDIATPYELLVKSMKQNKLGRSIMPINVVVVIPTKYKWPPMSRATPITR